MTLGRIALIGGAHLLIIGGGYFVTQFGSELEDGNQSLAGAVTWSSQSGNADQPTVDAASDTLFDSRASNLSGYNAGDGSSSLLAANSAPSGRSGRFAPRRPEEVQQPSEDRTNRQSDDTVLKPVDSNRGNDEMLFPAQSPSRPGESLSGTIEYTVQNGDSVWGISRRFGVDQREILAANPGLKPPSIRVGQKINIPRSSGASAPQGQVSPARSPSPAQASGSVYTIKSGDSLSRIASRQGVTVSELMAANNLSNDVIRIGQELIIPSDKRVAELASKQHRGPTVTVEAGDTLDKFAAIYGVSTRELMELNEIANPRLIRIGQVLLIPERNGGQGLQATQERPAARPQTPQSQPPARTESRPPARSLDALEVEEEPSRPSLDSLSDFSEEDLEEQPLIPIQE